ncbi:MAG TPA: DUF4142 domain-containing protein [Lunatimonas sp.]|nr:DUF4142 domain-containing protein [Lunatimonas sp.]
MKIPIKINSVLILSLCMAGPLLLGTSCSENKATDSMEAAEEENISRITSNDTTMVVIENDNDGKFLMDAAEMQLEEISLGKLAQEKGNSPHIKEMGKMMEEDHAKAFTELKALAQAKSVSIPTSITEDSKDIQESLMEETGNDFDKAYSDLMVEKHEDAVAKFEKVSTDSEDNEIRTWATGKLPGLKAHLKHAEDAKEKIDN